MISNLCLFVPLQAGGVDADVINEAHGLIGDLLLKESLTEDANHKLKRVKELLAPRDTRHISYTPRMIVGKGD